MFPIKRISRGGLLVIAAVLLAGGLLLSVLQRRNAESGGPAKGTVAHEHRRAESLEQQMQAALARVSKRKDIVRQLLAGQVTLVAAARSFRALDLEAESFSWEAFRRTYPGDTDEERHCREVIDWVAGELKEADPCWALSVLCQVERELEEALRRGAFRPTSAPP
jgi:hypothetical protein